MGASEKPVHGRVLAAITAAGNFPTIDADSCYGCDKPCGFCKVRPTRHEIREAGRIWYVVIGERHSHYWDVKVYRPIYWSLDGMPSYQLLGEDDNVTVKTTEDVSQAQPTLAGTIKWDGCSDWQIDELSDSHYCGLVNATEPARVMTLLYSMAAKLIPAWDGEGG
jgi:hypothetical protein